MINLFFIIVVASISIVQIEPAPYDLLVLILIVVELIINPEVRQNVKKLSLLTALMGLFVLANVFSLINAQNIYHSLFYFSVTLYLIFTAMFWQGFSIKKQNFDLVVSGYLAAAWIALGVGFAAYLLDFPLLHRFMYSDMRMMSSFKDPNVFGAFLVPAFMIGLWKTGSGEFRWNSIIFTSLAAAGIVLSFSRGAWISTLVTVAVFCLASFRTLSVQSWKRFFLIAAGALMISSLMLSYSGRWDFLFSRFGFQSYDTVRFTVQQQGFEESITAKPATESAVEGMSLDFLGIGPGQFEERFNYAAHSLYIRTFRENGWLGILSLLFFGALLVGEIWLTSMRRSDNTLPLLFSIVIGMLVLSFVIDSVHWRHFWLFIGLAMGRIKGENSF